jgi:cell division protein FtsL
MSSPAMQVRSRIPKIAGAAVERARLTVVPRRRRTAGRAPFLALVTTVLLGGVVGLLLFNTSLQQASFATTSLEQQATRLAARQQSLEMELDDLRNPQRIAASAKRLGMVQACSPAFVQLGSGTVTGTTCAGGSAEAPSLRINPNPPAKPAILDPKPTVVTVDPPAGDSSANSGDDTGAGNQDQGGRDGKKKNNR